MEAAYSTSPAQPVTISAFLSVVSDLRHYGASDGRRKTATGDLILSIV